MSQFRRYEEAINVFKEALAITPNKPWLHYHFGVTYYDKGLSNLFVRSSTRWSQQGKLTEGDNALFVRFGYSVALSGDTALVGGDGP